MASAAFPIPSLGITLNTDLRAPLWTKNKANAFAKGALRWPSPPAQSSTIPDGGDLAHRMDAGPSLLAGPILDAWLPFYSDFGPRGGKNP